ncbi:hypothetical protein [Streptomyces fagopyri]|uniref:hypothetical protein n=1 Tax=Streptomyces fagopyri TaxID=2662397 RepID=UPI003403B867
MPTRTFAVAAAVGAAAFATTGITYASPAESVHAAPAVQRALPAAHKAAPSAKKAVPATPPLDGGTVSRDKGEGGDRDGGDRGDRGHGSDHEGPGYIYFNERTYSGSIEGCIAAASGLGANSFSIYNDSRRTVEVYRGFNCNGGSPVATVGPHGATHGVVTGPAQGDGAFGADALIAGAMFGDDGVVGSFRVINDDEW